MPEVRYLKTKMSFINKYIRNITLTALCGLLWACTDNDIPSNKGGDDFYVPEGMTKLTLLLPDYNGNAAQFGTRAFNPDEEGYMSNLYVVAVKYANFDELGNPIPLEEQIVYTYSLNPVGELFQLRKDRKDGSGQSGSDGTYETYDYHKFNMALYPGQYKFGLIANADLYLDRATKITEFRQEQQLKELILNFNEATPLSPLHLPMECVPEKVRYCVKETDNNGVVKYYEDMPGKGENFLIDIGNPNDIRENKENVIIANMTFLCAKVRYTILFDKTEDGISSAFGSSWIRFNVDETYKPFATNIRKQVKLFPDMEISDESRYDTQNPFMASTSGSSNGIGQWTISIDRFKWHTVEEENYPLTPNSTLTPWDRTTNEWINSEQKVWQGIVYLPENPGVTYTYEENGQQKSEVIKTVLKFPYYTRINSNDDTPEELAPNPKEIYLFGNDHEEKFEGVSDSGEYKEFKPDPDKPFVPFEGLQRNYMYDVVAKVVNPNDVYGLEVRFISILPWHEIEQDITDESWLGGYDENASSQNGDTPSQD